MVKKVLQFFLYSDASGAFQDLTITAAVVGVGAAPLVCWAEAPLMGPARAAARHLVTVGLGAKQADHLRSICFPEQNWLDHPIQTCPPWQNQLCEIFLRTTWSVKVFNYTVIKIAQWKVIVYSKTVWKSNILGDLKNKWMIFALNLNIFTPNWTF